MKRTFKIHNLFFKSKNVMLLFMWLSKNLTTSWPGLVNITACINSSIAFVWQINQIWYYTPDVIDEYSKCYKIFTKKQSWKMSFSLRARCMDYDFYEILHFILNYYFVMWLLYLKNSLFENVICKMRQCR